MAFSDQDIFLNIKNNPNPDLYIKQLYVTNWKKIRSYILKNSGSEEEAKDVFQDAMIILVEKIYSNHITLKASLGTILFGISKNLWLKSLRSQKIQKIEHTLDELSKIPDDWDQNDQETLDIESIFFELKEDCQEILRLSIYQKRNMNEIANIMQFKNEQIARNKKSKCLGYLRKLIGKTSNPLVNEQ
ncbi:MAG: sigma-70 family RNA polymerase sigma factor [Flavobacteriales bacterium]|nr:sigma-70 family RNA polymerase sigma factor [Flavobacteriales bacterium]